MRAQLHPKDHKNDQTVYISLTSHRFEDWQLLLQGSPDTPSLRGHTHTQTFSLSNTLSLVHALSLKRQDTNHINCFLGGIENPESRSVNSKAFKSTKQENIFKIVSCQSIKLKIIYTADFVSCVFSESCTSFIKIIILDVAAVTNSIRRFSWLDPWLVMQHD